MEYSRIVIVGASGYLGTALTELAGRAQNVVLATFHSNPCSVGYSNVKSIRLDFADANTVIQLQEVLSTTDLIIIATNMEYESMGSNLQNYESFLRHLVERQLKVIFISTDAVFDGRQSVYTEEDIPMPITNYGRLKRRFEEIIGVDTNLIVRTSYIYGYNGFTEDKRTKELWRAHEAGEAVWRYTNLIRNPIYVWDLAIIILLLKRESGIFHAAGPAMSAYHFAQRLAELAGIPVAIRGRELELGQDTEEFVPLNTNLSTAKVGKYLGTEIDGMEQSILWLREQGGQRHV